MDTVAEEHQEAEQSHKKEKETNNIISEDDNGEAKKENGNVKKNEELDPEFFSCLLQPSTTGNDTDYVGIRRLLLHRKAQSGVHGRIVRILIFFFFN